MRGIASISSCDVPTLRSGSRQRLARRDYTIYGRKCKKIGQRAADSAQWYDSRMIGYIEGTVKAARDAHLIVLTGGVGYKVGVLKETVLRTAVGSPVSLWIYTAVREDALDLYGFAHEEELRFFELLLTVSGIGPKSALGIGHIARRPGSTRSDARARILRRRSTRGTSPDPQRHRIRQRPTARGAQTRRQMILCNASRR